MALSHKDFLLTQDQIDLINKHFTQMAVQAEKEGEDPPCGAKVVFEWMPGLGRFVTAFFDSAIKGVEIENALN